MTSSIHKKRSSSKRFVKKYRSSEDHKLDERLEETFPASDATAQYK